MVDNSKFTGYVTINAFYLRPRLQVTLQLMLLNTEYTTCFYKHMKLRNKARLCLAILDFEAQIMLRLSQ